MDQVMNDVQMVRALKDGDKKAFEWLFDCYHKRLYGFLYKLLNSKDDAEEIVQDTFVKIWEKRLDIREGFSFESFLFKIAKNTFLNSQRKKVNRQLVESELLMVSDSEYSSSDQYVLFKETQQIIDTIVDGLPPRRKEIFVMRRIEGLSRKEIAEKLDISILTIDSQLLKANSHLKEGLKKYSLLVFALTLS